MDSPSLLASSAFLSLLLHPASPLYSLFTPLSLLSLLRSLRLSLKSPQSHSPAPPAPRKRKRKSKPSPVPASPDLLPKVLDLLHTALLCRVRLAATSDAVKSLVETLTTLLTSFSTARVTDLCYHILYTIVSMPEHGDQLTSAVEVMRALVPAILSKRPAALTFVVNKIVPLGKDVQGVGRAMVYLPRFVAVKAPERADGRACAVDAILVIVRAMGEGARDGFVDYVVKMAQGKSGLRLLAVDLMLAMLMSLADPLGVKEGDHSDDYWGVKCLRALGERCSDSVGGIRARALTNVAQVVGILSGDERNVERLKGATGFGNAGLSELLRRRCVDEKAAVRKAALLLVTKSMTLIGRPVDGLILKTMGAACSDPLVSIRKAALTALSEVYRKFPDARVVDEWLHAVPPLIADNEISIQEECENLFLELVFDRISRVLNVSLSEEVTDLESLVPDGVLALLKGICDGDVAPCVRKICASLGKKKKLKDSIAKSLINIIKLSKELWLRGSVPIESWTAPPGAWQLLSEVSSLFTPEKDDWVFLLELLDKEKDIGNLEEKAGMFDGVEQNSMSWAGDRVSLLQTISNLSVKLKPPAAADIAYKLHKRIGDFNMHLSEVDAHVKTLRTLCKRKVTDPDEGNAFVLTLVHQLLSKALKLLYNYLSEATETGRVDTFFTPPRSAVRKEKRETTPSKSMLQAVIAVFTVGSLILVCPSADLQGIIPLLQNIITSGSAEPRPKKLAGLTFCVKERAPSLYIQSWVTMGKICLVDDKLAKCYIPLFVQELEKSDCAAVRNNIMVMMADFCVRYTSLVDCYIAKITISLRDPCEVVRRQSFILLSRLLQRDYVKWRGVLFLRFLVSLVDDSEKIRHVSDFLFGNILKVKAPLLAYNSFIEAIFVLNDCHAHAGHTDTSGSRQNRSFSIRGNSEIARSKRMHIYVSLLKQMAPEHLLATSAKICAEILAAASDGLLNIDDVTGKSVLQDALLILACKEMRIHPSRSADTTDMDDEGGDGGGGAALLAAKRRVVTQVAKKNLIQIAVPVFIELKRLLESKNSPITGCLMECLRVLLKDYKNEFDEILVADKQLQKELIYDMQKYDAAKAKSTVAKAVANEQRVEGFHSPLNPSDTRIYAKVSEKLGTGGKIASAIADAAARTTARSVLKEVNRNIATPPLHTMSVPRLKTTTGIGQPSRGNRPFEVLESLRRRQSFEFDDEN